MALRDIFIVNLKKTRKEKRVSQMKLAEMCNTAASYIGEIETGRKFPSVEMMEKIAGALDIEAYRLFVDGSAANKNNQKTAAYFSRLPPESRQFLLDNIMNAVRTGFLKTLDPENEPVSVPRERSPKKKTLPQESTD
ncbi:MAG: helix-turn-helix domain-containing protein [Treponema sp.]|jgi:transcriptional regulator with XRE-family HTH domain|nr:helix-turn-helix domain-containing protein [Treponema sp.]